MSNKHTSEAPERWFNLMGLVVVTKTDLLAAAAFFSRSRQSHTKSGVLCGDRR